MPTEYINALGVPFQDIPVHFGGTGNAAFPLNSLIVGNGTQALTSIIPGNDGQVLIGKSGTSIPAFASLTSNDASITFTAGPNTLDLSAVMSGGGVTWSEVTGTSQAMAVNMGYIANNAGLVTLTLPDTAALGSVLRVAGKGAGGWRIAQNAGETIHFGSQNTTTGVGGYLEFTVQYDAVELVCITANTNWVVISSIGNITVV